MRTAVLDRFLKEKLMLPSVRGEASLVVLIIGFFLFISAGCGQHDEAVTSEPAGCRRKRHDARG